MAEALPSFPTRHVPLEFRGGPRMAGALELAAPLALGQRGLVVAPPRSGATTVLGWLGSAIAFHVPDARIHVVLVDRPVEERLDWRDWVPGAAFHGTTSDDEGGAEAHAAAVQPFEIAAAEAADGHDVALLVDSLGSLARALTATRDLDDARELDGGIAQPTLIELRRLFGLARPQVSETGGSLTILATVSAETSSQLDEVILHELVGTGNVEWRLDADAMQTGLFPPVDLDASGARRSELILGEEEAARRGHAHAVLDDLGPLPGLALLLERLDMDGPLSRVLDDLVG